MLTRRTALMSGLAAALGLPLAHAKENPMVAIPVAPRCNAAEATGDTNTLTPCHPKNDARHERLTILVHHLREEFRRLHEEHDDDCGCEACHVADGLRWILEVSESCLDSCIVGFWIFWRLEEGSAMDAADVANRLNLPLAMVEEYVAYHNPKTTKAREIIAAYEAARGI